VILALLACTDEVAVDSASTAICPPLSGLEVPRTLSFEVHDEADLLGGSWTRTVEVEGASPRVIDEGTLISEDGEVGFRTVDEYRCDSEGLWWTWHSEDLDAEVPTAHSQVDWSEPPRILSWEPEVGDRWEGEQEYVRTSDDHQDAPAREAYVVEVVGAYFLTVAAGTFEVLDVRLDGRPSFRTPDLGEVRTDRADLVGWQDIE